MTAIHQRVEGHQQLNRRHQYLVIIANRCAEQPIVVLEITTRFAGIHARSRAEAKRIQRSEKARGIHSFRQIAEVIIARIGERVMQLEGVVDALVRACDLIIFVLENAPTLNARIVISDTGTQGDERGKRLDRGAGRESLFKCQAGIEDGADAPILRVQHNDRAFACAECLGCCTLDCGISKFDRRDNGGCLLVSIGFRASEERGEKNQAPDSEARSVVPLRVSASLR